MRERKSNAVKQFAYNKLKNEKHTGIKMDQKKSSTAPQRPPQPKIVNHEKKEKEGMLIDISPPQQQDISIPSTSNGLFSTKLNDKISILDAPIDVPTENFVSEEQNSIDLFGSNGTVENSKPEPPPYQSPPTYMNTYGMTQSTINYNSTLSTEHHQKQQYGNIVDPFDTSHILTSKKQMPNYNAITTATIASPNRYSQDVQKLDVNFIRNQIQPKTSTLTNAVCKTNGTTSSIVRQRPTASNQLDEMIQNRIASLSPKSSHTSLSAHGSKCSSPAMQHSTLNAINIETHCSNDDISTKSPMHHSDALSDSLRVNLSSLTLNDTGDNETLSVVASTSTSLTTNESPPTTKLDRAFLAELEKEIYKNDMSTSNLNVNTTQSTNYTNSTNAKENTVSAINSEMYGNQSTFNWLHNNTNAAMSLSSMPSNVSYQSIGTPTMMQSPAKYTNDSIKTTNYESASNMTLNKKLYKAEIVGVTPNSPSSSSATSSSPSLNQMIAKHMTATSNNSNQPIYNNYAATTNAVTNNVNHLEQTHNFVAVSNRPVSAINSVPSHSNLLRANNSNNIYNSMPGDVYGSVAGENVYDIVAGNSTNASMYYGTVPNTGRTDNYYQTIQNNDGQTVIYDEVAADDYLRPHRKAPMAPPVLSAQQIARRLDKVQKENQFYGNLDANNLYANNGFMGGASDHSKYEEINQKIHSLMKEVANDGDPTEQEAKDALNAANWDHNQAVRNFKTARLLR